MPLPARSSILADNSLSAITAGLVTVLVGFAGTAVLVFQAATHLGADQAEIGSWMWALGIGMGVTCAGLSLRWRIPVVTSWSTPGAAMLISSVAGVPLADAIGAFVVAAVLSTVAGFSGVFARLMRKVPMALASGMLAGVLLKLGLDLFVSIQSRPVMGLSMFAVYLGGRRWFPRYAVIATLLIGISIALLNGSMHLGGVQLALAHPKFIVPGFSVQAVVGIAIPLFVVTMASQNIPGVAVARASGYELPVSPVLGWTGITNTLLAPFGAFSLNLAAITAALCMGPDAHENPKRRYMASVWTGLFYIVVGIFGATVASVLGAFPKELVMALAGLALLGTIGSSLESAMRDERDREAALVTFLVTASGISVAGIGATFWGLLAGSLVLLVMRRRR